MVVQQAKQDELSAATPRAAIIREASPSPSPALAIFVSTRLKPSATSRFVVHVFPRTRDRERGSGATSHRAFIDLPGNQLLLTPKVAVVDAEVF